MKRKDYALIAKVIKKLPGEVKEGVFKVSVRLLVFTDMAKALKEDNANLNTDLFKKDCGL